jgi:ribosomal protein L35
VTPFRTTRAALKHEDRHRAPSLDQYSRSVQFIRDARGTMVLNDSDAKIVKKYMPYAR